jgi:hypothetical protein
MLLAFSFLLFGIGTSFIIKGDAKVFTQVGIPIGKIGGMLKSYVNKTFHCND